METWMWLLIGAAAILVIALVAWTMASRRRTSTLRNRFGDEYDRTVERSDSQRQAEVDLRDRTRQREQLDIRPLAPAARNRYVEEWLGIQQRFVDQPAVAVDDAESLLTRVMSDRGYPDDFEHHVDVVSVDHPRLVDNYRSAHAVRQRTGTSQATTEDMREALVHYRALFEELLGSDDDVAWRDDALPDQSADARQRGSRT